MKSHLAEIRSHLLELYGTETGQDTFNRLVRLIEGYRPLLPSPRPFSFSQRDAVLITYADIIREAGRAPLATLKDFLGRHLEDAIQSVHLLPFFPSSSDDGFSVVDYKSVDPAIGDWGDVDALARDYDLMFDAVINHASVGSRWFRKFLQGDPAYQDHFLAIGPGTDLSQVFRPRALPLLTAFETHEGEKQVWTTFSEDQADLNYRNPEVLLDIIDVLLFYVQRGAVYLRLDAIAFLWKTPGTRCLHLPQTHAVVRLFRLIFNEVAPQTVIITETNVPHDENISYFGDGVNEAQAVYNFSLPPLVLHAIHRGDASALTAWARLLELPSSRATFFNFLASHDGIGVTPAQGLLSDSDIESLGSRVEALGGRVSYRTRPDGSQGAYELNINYLDALGDPSHPGEEAEWVARRFLLSQSIMLGLRGVPGIYFHSLWGSRGWPEGIAQTGRNRTINREKLQRSEVETALRDPGSLRNLVFYPYRRLLERRGAEGRTAFSPVGGQVVLELDARVFAVRRVSPDGDDTVWCLSNVSGQTVRVHLEPSQVNARSKSGYTDLISERHFPTGRDGGLEVALGPYQAAWLIEAM